ncbi:MAG: sigma-54-dependent Fis family transcriptional regulator, partial [Alistipes sp.]|nr:sigma-54-dependent Fis family transcriptional regulator [Alistipes sp.]
MTEITTIKQRFGIIGTSELLDRALEVALRVAPTDLTVLVTGESGVGKEYFPQVIHAYSARKHNKYIAVNCAAIPEGTIDSELFGHEKGAFTGAVEARKGYFEEADGGTIFLDEVAELPHSTQARLLRVLQSGEFIRVGSSKVQKTNVRVVAATNVQLQEAILQGRFREDLYYRLATVPIVVPALRERKHDIPLLFRKFAADVAVQYRMPSVTLDDAACELLKNYYWRGNIRQLKNVAEQISAIEQVRVITPDILRRYLPDMGHATPMAAGSMRMEQDYTNERELLYKLLFDMRAEIGELKR